MRVTETKFTRTRAMAVKSAVLAAARAGDSVLDLQSVTSADSSAVAVVLAWVRVVQAAGRTPVLKNVPVKMTALMELYGITELLSGFVAT